MHKLYLKIEVADCARLLVTVVASGCTDAQVKGRQRRYDRSSQ